MYPEDMTPTLTRAKPAPPELDIDDDCEPTKEEIVEDLRLALCEALAGEDGMPALECIAAD